ncbi:hypothetical protein PO124_16800 [Bacillus licheniformis]|nr:hypothetical protein [Bacillus licheniformis]
MVLICMFMIIAGFIMAWRHYYGVPWIRFKLFCLSSVFQYLPAGHRTADVLSKWNAQGDSAVEYMKGEALAAIRAIWKQEAWTVR